MDTLDSEAIQVKVTELYKLAVFVQSNFLALRRHSAKFEQVVLAWDKSEKQKGCFKSRSEIYNALKELARILP